MTGEESVLDQAALAQLLDVIGGKTSDLAELIESFLDESPGLMEQLREGIRASKTDLVRRASHTLKSSARDFGALDLSMVCATLEHDSNSGRLTNAAGLVAEIETRYAIARMALEDLLKTYRS